MKTGDFNEQIAKVVYEAQNKATGIHLKSIRANGYRIIIEGDQVPLQKADGVAKRVLDLLAYLTE